MSEHDDALDRHLRRANVAADLQRWAAVEREARAALALAPDHVDAMLVLAHSLSAQSRQQESADVAREAVARAPDDAFAHYRVGYALLMHNLPLEALAPLREAVRLDPDCGCYAATLAYCLAEADIEPGEQRSLAALALELSGVELWTSDYVGLTYCCLGDGVEAERVARMCIEAEPEVDINHLVLAWALRLQGKTAEATEAALVCLRLCPTNSGAHVEHALGLCALGAFDEAERIARAAVADTPRAWEQHHALLTILLARGERGAAKTALDEALAINAEHPRMRALRRLVEEA